MTLIPEDGYPNYTPQQWADKLRSDVYIQAHKSWHETPSSIAGAEPTQEKHCCLSVLAAEMGWTLDDNGEFADSEAWLIPWLLHHNLPGSIQFVHWNDGIAEPFGDGIEPIHRIQPEPLTFAEIADRIEEYL